MLGRKNYRELEYQAMAIAFQHSSLKTAAIAGWWDLALMRVKMIWAQETAAMHLIVSKQKACLIILREILGHSSRLVILLVYAALLAIACQLLAHLTKGPGSFWLPL
jgi:hypothetical protein